MLKGKGILSGFQSAFLRLFAEPRDAVDLYFLLQKTGIEELVKLAPQKDSAPAYPP